MRYGHRGFTLIELVGVLAIMALLAGAASLELGGSRHKADLADAVGQLQSADLSARTLARSRDQPVTLSISIADGSIHRSTGDTATTLGRLPADIRIARIRQAGTAIDFGTVSITIHPQGTSVSYAVELVCTNGDRQWIFFSGMSGQMLKVDDENLDAILQLCSGQTWPDAG
jgi:prepilin-type N-terminal cleavage/methylation domain-containing protein